MQAGASNGPVTPGTPDSAHIIIGAAGYVAHERRQPHPPKRLMNCFRDRSTTTSSSAHYARSHSSTATAATTALLRLESSAGSSQALDQAGIAAGGGGAGRPEAVVLLRELRTKPNKLTLLKSSSSRDLTRLLLDESSTALLVSNGSLDMCSSNASSAGSPAQVRDRNGSRECCTVCGRRWHNLKQRMHTLEQDLQAQASYSQELEQKLADLSRQLAELVQEKRQPVAAFTAGAGKRYGGGVTPVRPSRLAAWMNLANWWKSRPSVETLREQRIFFDEPCFDTELELVLKHEQHRTVPRIVIDCCDLIEQKYRRSSQPVEGIYRQCGDYNKIQTLRFNIDANDYDALRRPGVDIHALTGVLKLFLREIKSPLISVNEAKTFIGPSNQWLLTEQNQKLDILKRLIRSLPEINRDTMDYLFGHFNRLTKVPLQQISAETLSISITPSIFHTVAQGVHMNDIQELLREGETLADCVRLMIEYQGRIFECTADRRLKRLSVRNLKKTLSQPDLLFHNLF
ncbi:rho GTPase-activating protein 27 isoform X1 [Drosophila novamexicana]|uniref:rho GTPase-activating protein 27 isoform X1 n=2 Tax=Drosophila novamexicana TaxID=47314 RepID=UPI0011E59583|nr:rho GTPase-activating protein 27 isoform X1 [Drosophila novamexicana]XP_030566266.1 rho GTPase-activating protein 27 isoform X1 [Drosophila novamexicana]